MTYTHKATITFWGQFPLDMLRYDHCYPASEKDSGLIEDSFTDPFGRREVDVACLTSDKKEPWTVDRWKSFSCKVSNTGLR